MNICTECGEEHITYYRERWFTPMRDDGRERRHMTAAESVPCPKFLERLSAARRAYDEANEVEFIAQRQRLAARPITAKHHWLRSLLAKPRAVPPLSWRDSLVSFTFRRRPPLETV